MDRRKQQPDGVSTYAADQHDLQSYRDANQALSQLQAPILLLGVLALARWRETPETVKLGLFSSLLYLFLLFPRDEWHGGWAPPLRYLVVFAPVLVLSAAAAFDRMTRFTGLLVMNGCMRVC